jgi:uncharacterized membrane protein YedE/YeeE
MFAFIALLLGALFGGGLVLGGMTQPAKVIGFLDVTGAWDPSLAFVMGGAIAVFAPLYRFIVKDAGPTYENLGLVKAQPIDGRLVLGAVLFGVGWGLGGYCPGPGLTAVGSGQIGPLIFSATMLVGMGLFHAYNVLSDRWRANTSTRTSTRTNT